MITKLIHAVSSSFCTWGSLAFAHFPIGNSPAAVKPPQRLSTLNLKFSSSQRLDKAAASRLHFRILIILLCSISFGVMERAPVVSKDG